MSMLCALCCADVSEEGLRALLAGSAAAVEAGSLRLRSTGARLRPKVRWSQEEALAHTQRRGAAAPLYEGHERCKAHQRRLASFQRYRVRPLPWHRDSRHRLQQGTALLHYCTTARILLFT